MRIDRACAYDEACPVSHMRLGLPARRFHAAHKKAKARFARSSIRVTGGSALATRKCCARHNRALTMQRAVNSVQPAHPRRSASALSPDRSTRRGWIIGILLPQDAPNARATSKTFLLGKYKTDRAGMRRKWRPRIGLQSLYLARSERIWPL